MVLFLTYLLLTKLITSRWIGIKVLYVAHARLWTLSGITWVSRYQNQSGSTEARDSDWQWHQLGHMQICTSPQTDNHASTPPLITGRMSFLPPIQQRHSTEG